MIRIVFSLFFCCVATGGVARAPVAEAGKLSNFLPAPTHVFLASTVHLPCIDPLLHRVCANHPEFTWWPGTVERSKNVVSVVVNRSKKQIERKQKLRK